MVVVAAMLRRRRQVIGGVKEAFSNRPQSRERTLAGEAVFAEPTDCLEKDPELNVSKLGAALGLRPDVKMPAVKLVTDT